MKTIWIFAAGMRRSASTLQYHLIREIIEAVGGKAVGFVTWQQFQSIYDEYDGEYPFVLLKSHIHIPEYVKSAQDIFNEDRGRIFYIYRDIRDVIASLLQSQILKADFNYLIKKDLPAILNEHHCWNNYSSEHMCISRYEDLDTTSIPELVIESIRYQVFLDINMELNHFRLVAPHTINNHQELLHALDYTEKGYNKEYLMWHNHISDGKIGKYKTVLTPEQITQIEKVAHHWLRERDYFDENTDTKN